MKIISFECLNYFFFKSSVSQVHNPAASVRDQPLTSSDQEAQRSADFRSSTCAAGGRTTLCQLDGLCWASRGPSHNVEIHEWFVGQSIRKALRTFIKFTPLYFTTSHPTRPSLKWLLFYVWFQWNKFFIKLSSLLKAYNKETFKCFFISN